MSPLPVAYSHAKKGKTKTPIVGSLRASSNIRLCDCLTSMIVQLAPFPYSRCIHGNPKHTHAIEMLFPSQSILQVKEHSQKLLKVGDYIDHGSGYWFRGEKNNVYKRETIHWLARCQQSPMSGTFKYKRKTTRARLSQTQ